MKRMKDILKRFLLLIGAVLLLIAGCAKPPVADMAAKKNTEQLVEKAKTAAQKAGGLAAPLDGGDISPLYERFAIPQRYSTAFSSDSGNLTVTADATIRLPDTERLPIVRVRARDFTQEEVYQIFHVLCGDTPMYTQLGDGGYTRAQLEAIIESLVEMLEQTEDEKQKAQYETYLAGYREQLRTTPEVLDTRSVPCDGTLREHTAYGHVLLYTNMAVNAFEKPEGHEQADGLQFFADNNSYDLSDAADWGEERGATIRFTSPRKFDFYTINPFIYIEDESAVPQPATGKLSLTPAQARAEAERLLAQMGILQMAVTGVYLTHNSNDNPAMTFSQDKEPQTEADVQYAYAVMCGMNFCGATIGPTADGSASSIGTDDYENEAYAKRWYYESFYLMLDDDGLFRMLWRSPVEVQEIVVEDCSLSVTSYPNRNWLNDCCYARHNYPYYNMHEAIEIVDSSALPENAAKIAYSFDEAKSLADGIVASSGVTATLKTAYLISDVQKGDVDYLVRDAEQWAYKFVYQRSIDGVPVAADAWDSVGFINEKIECLVDSGGLAEFTWTSPITTMPDSVGGGETISFDAAKEIFQSTAMLTYGNRAKMTSEKLDHVEYTVQVDDIQLCYMPLSTPESGEGAVVPAWVFYGNIQHLLFWKDGTMLDLGWAQGGNGNTSSQVLRGKTIVFAINAIDGSVIDVAQGY